MVSQPEIATATPSPKHTHPMGGKVNLLDNELSAVPASDISLLFSKLGENSKGTFYVIRRQSSVIIQFHCQFMK